ncbi:MAG: holo-ACP synthase [Bacteroidota bacterium]|nr:holo-ACP synthase [Bacteroidota bacterium]MDP4232885.1 holo-ACP synthase [Bacteroidota bacterium]MDP4241929.1 holo-ACP synthase [Bacteroidota bacterium]MDP4286832.1 holo-ACP synthase [Bacteroidota bacterium]
MIFGIGIDAIEVARIQRAIETYGDQFLNRIYSKEEIRYCSRKPRLYEHYAARFAAKEAYAKAIGTGVRRKFTWRNVVVQNEMSGQPYITLRDEMAERARRIIGSDFRVRLSLTHTRDMAEAIVTIEKDES